MLSKHVYASWGKGISNRVIDELPEGAVILDQQNNFDRAGMDMLVYHEKFDVVTLGGKVPRMLLDLPLNTEVKKPKLVFPH